MNSPRKSCLDCVEKHLGAAWVLIGEHKDGYPHKMLAIGHLHEAGEESWAWPELHNSIRDMRKIYHETGECPKFEVLTLLIQKIKGI